MTYLEDRPSIAFGVGNPFIPHIDINGTDVEAAVCRQLSLLTDLGELLRVILKVTDFLRCYNTEVVGFTYSATGPEDVSSSASGKTPQHVPYDAQ
ncbi:hypothetical protein GDO78_010789 [Eleutherodactylus coqui]|uniref:Uncharacterized protein n=1 Tax=Eleutherodactylus coqui TaxID=57060 RepID=A0A8J6K6L3_ELECQ|nr:hypothetical protein GDO78_010789 [Eleutherodactylus coqui]